ncbi:hypothetical protein ES319_A11G134500v1 [Gossypium barbadense]|uniref:Uncharacterized protein n=1 Tax=Gossypium barbadense TaxID=3634 RepID=A0A5J5TM71_GOSBA|nr:hypothetical protein ES319_A11G134500v1 [Gossypium barbadense]
MTLRAIMKEKSHWGEKSSLVSLSLSRYFSQALILIQKSINQESNTKRCESPFLDSAPR